jgi:hypothetical protein
MAHANPALEISKQNSLLKRRHPQENIKTAWGKLYVWLRKSAYKSGTRWHPKRLKQHKTYFMFFGDFHDFDYQQTRR